MMMKEYIIKNYGEIKYTMGNGCSGGSIGQNTVVSTYPGPARRHPGAVRLLRLDHDRHRGHRLRAAGQLLRRPAWATLMAPKASRRRRSTPRRPPSTATSTRPAATPGTTPSASTTSRATTRLLVARSTRPDDLVPTARRRTTASCRRAQVYDPVTNPTGTALRRPGPGRRSLGRLGRRAPNRAQRDDRQRRRAVRIEGIARGEDQRRGVRDAEREDRRRGCRLEPDRRALGGRHGGADHRLPDGHRLEAARTSRKVADHRLARLRRRRRGLVGIHYIWRSFAERDRLDQDGGGHANQVMWRFGTGPDRTGAAAAAVVPDDGHWLSTLLPSAPKATLNGERTRRRSSPPSRRRAFDFCYLTTDTTFSTKVTDQRSATPTRSSRSTRRRTRSPAARARRTSSSAR